MRRARRRHPAVVERNDAVDERPMFAGEEHAGVAAMRVSHQQDVLVIQIDAPMPAICSSSVVSAFQS